MTISEELNILSKCLSLLDIDVIHKKEIIDKPMNLPYYWYSSADHDKYWNNYTYKVYSQLRKVVRPLEHHYGFDTRVKTPRLSYIGYSSNTPIIRYNEYVVTIRNFICSVLTRERFKIPVIYRIKGSTEWVKSETIEFQKDIMFVGDKGVSLQDIEILE